MAVKSSVKIGREWAKFAREKLRKSVKSKGLVKTGELVKSIRFTTKGSAGRLKKITMTMVRHGFIWDAYGRQGVELMGSGIDPAFMTPLFQKQVIVLSHLLVDNQVEQFMNEISTITVS